MIDLQGTILILTLGLVVSKCDPFRLMANMDANTLSVFARDNC